MPYTCCVPGCRGNYKNGPKVHVFGFPRDTDMREKWMAAISRHEYNPTKHSRVCDRHFRKEEIIRISEFYDERTDRLLTCSIKTPRLRQGTIPSIFPNVTKLTGTRKRFNISKTSNIAETSESLPEDSSNDRCMITNQEEAITVKTESRVTDNFSKYNSDVDDVDEDVVIVKTESGNNTLLKSAKETTIYCRFCLELVERNTNYISISNEMDETVKEVIKMINTVMPRLDLSLTFNPIICDQCHNQLSVSFRFISSCMSNQDQLVQNKEHIPEEPLVEINEILLTETCNQDVSRKRKLDSKNINVNPGKEILEPAALIKEESEIEIEYHGTSLTHMVESEPVRNGCKRVKKLQKISNENYPNNSEIADKYEYKTLRSKNRIDSVRRHSIGLSTKMMDNNKEISGKRKKKIKKKKNK